ncbi:MAG: aminotransferase class IV family protein [Rhizobiaceae bacterium]
MSVESTLRGRADRSFGLIETLRFEPDHGCIRAERHLARMASSAKSLGKKFDADQAVGMLASVESDTPLRVRLYLDVDNALSLTTHPFVPVADGKVWTVAIADTKLEAGNTLLPYKTSLREVYDAARAEFDTSLVDEVLLTNQHGHLCEGTITNLFVQQGKTLVTPPLADGLLRGILRQELLDRGEAIEGVVKPADLAAAPFFVGNSLRGLIPAKLLKASS